MDEFIENDQQSAEVPVETEEVDNRGQWFVIQTLSGNENKVRDTLQRQIKLGDRIPVYEAFIPTEKICEYRDRKKVEKTRKVFPGYVFVRMDLYNNDGSINEAAWYFVRGVQGVMGFPGGNDRPLPLTNSEIEELRHRPGGEEDDHSVEKCIYEVGDRVQIKEDAFEGFEGVVQEVDRTRGRLVISVSVFGRSTPVELGFWQVERLS